MRRLLFLMVGGSTLVLLVAVAALVGSGLRDQPGRADLALVLGNKVNEDGSPSARLRARLDRAADLFREGRFPRILVSGGTGREGHPEGTVMRDYLVRRGVPEAAIIVDNAGVDTAASARNTVTALRERGLSSVFVVTQYFQVPRARLALQRLGVSPVFSSHARFFEARDGYSVLRELPAYAKYWLRRDFPDGAGASR